MHMETHPSAWPTCTATEVRVSNIGILKGMEDKSKEFI